MKKKAKKKGFMDGYKTYNPSKEGYGDPSNWRDAFSQRMGIEEARETLGSSDPFVILGVPSNATWEEIKAAHRKMAMKHHPDRCPGDENAATMFKRIQAAYEILADR